MAGRSKGINEGKAGKANEELQRESHWLCRKAVFSDPVLGTTLSPGRTGPQAEPARSWP